ncbi:hypothetical protein [Micromonospora sonneratiae]|uniref:Uncharacterized protein n=1 Tax=Micromonospora sonneratiae TaxID=1184706 RepID=A0ABW3YPE4_9ACTN
MPIVRGHQRGGKRVRGYYRLNSIWNSWFGLLLIVLLVAIARKR